jgi:hypothetical protein
MPLSPARLMDRWIGRAAQRDPRALAAVAGLAPAVAVTGASRGIGLALARQFAERGHPVLMIARGAEALAAAADRVRRTATGRVATLAIDATDPGAAAAIERTLAAERAYLDILVNNAAIGLGGPFEASRPEDIDALVALNVGAVTRLMRHALPAMKARGRGGILNIASLGGAVPGPYQAAYYASKAYVVSLSEAVAAESAGSGVRIAVVAPGPVDTGFHADMGAEAARYRLLLPAQSPDQVARSAYRGFMLGRRVIHPGLLAPVAAAAVKVLPHAVTVPLVAWLLDNRPR